MNCLSLTSLSLAPIISLDQIDFSYHSYLSFLPIIPQWPIILAILAYHFCLSLSIIVSIIFPIIMTSNDRPILACESEISTSQSRHCKKGRTAQRFIFRHQQTQRAKPTMIRDKVATVVSKIPTISDCEPVCLFCPMNACLIAVRGILSTLKTQFNDDVITAISHSSHGETAIGRSPLETSRDSGVQKLAASSIL